MGVYFLLLVVLHLLDDGVVSYPGPSLHQRSQTTERLSCRHPLNLYQCFRGRPPDRYQLIRQIPLIPTRWLSPRLPPFDELVL